jgi:hypothetical protein
MCSGFAITGASRDPQKIQKPHDWLSRGFLWVSSPKDHKLARQTEMSQTRLIVTGGMVKSTEFSANTGALREEQCE